MRAEWITVEKCGSTLALAQSISILISVKIGMVTGSATRNGNAENVEHLLAGLMTNSGSWRDRLYRREGDCIRSGTGKKEKVEAKTNADSG